MIQRLSIKYNKTIAWPLFVLFNLQVLSPVYAYRSNINKGSSSIGSSRLSFYNHARMPLMSSDSLHVNEMSVSMNDVSSSTKKNEEKVVTKTASAPNKVFMGGPSSPEASSFKAVGSDNLVNLFSGDFSYSIPLLDVGGYPVNLFYNGGVSMEQEASWVGLGWNINPGTVSRNMRGVPDDFNGEDLLVQSQNVKPNRTYGGEVGIDGEIIGIKKPKVSLSLGFSYNNYLGPALEVGAGASINLVTFENIKFAKAAQDTLLKLKLGLNAKLSSRSGLTLSPSLNAGLDSKDKSAHIGVGLNTSYNSRTGLRDLTIHSEVSAYKAQDKKEKSDSKSGKSIMSGSLGSSTFSFAKPSYIPTLRMPMENLNFSAQLELGGGIFGFRGSGTANGYYSESRVPSEWQRVEKPLVGFMYSEKAMDNKHAVMDFNRLNDGEVTPNTPVISAPQYTYDIFSIQGEGTGGSIRAYRGDLGYMKDNVTISKDINGSIGVDIAPPGHFGGNFNIISAPTKAGAWEDGSNLLKQSLKFSAAKVNSSFEHVYFKNPGETTVNDQASINKLGGDNVVRFKLEGSKANPLLTSKVEQFNKSTNTALGEMLVSNLSANTVEREKRSQVVTMLTAYDAAKVGLDTKIKNYTGGFSTENIIQFTNIERVGDIRKAHHISEIDVLEPNGMRYVYGLPVYSVKQKDYTFSVEKLPATSADLVAYNTIDEAKPKSKHMANSAKMDGYFTSQETPAYASSFLITGLLSPDYVDVTNDGITEDDLGGAVKFNYTKSADLHKWRSPRRNAAAPTDNAWATMNEGLKSEKKDNKAIISYGEREVWYMQSIESKSMIAVFVTTSRNDAKGVIGEHNAAINTNENANKKLYRIDLYTKAEIKEKGFALSKPIKSVVFDYDYSLCNGTPDNESGGKLTLKSVYFTYNGQIRDVKDRYVFDYGQSNENPSYALNASDKWGTYKDPTDATLNPVGYSNADHPYTSTNKTKNDLFAGAWSLKKILLPSGGQMEIEYEADDYAYVQDRKSCNMYPLVGLGNGTAYSSNSKLYNVGASQIDNQYVYVKLPQPLSSTSATAIKQEIFEKYLKGINQLAFKLQIKMPRGNEPLNVYANLDDYGVCPNSFSKEYIYIKLKLQNGKSPLANAAIGFLTSNLPGQAFPGYDYEVNNIGDFLGLVPVMLGSILTAFSNQDQQMRSSSKAREIVLAQSSIRLNDGDGFKYGGGVRVKKVVVKDNWKKMTERPGNTSGEFTSIYGQEYDYTTTEKINGTERTISSGVGTYEPGIGGEENPFREIIAFQNKLPLASAMYGAIEMPILDGFYPSASIGYSKVTVRSIHRKGTHGDSAVRSAIGKQVTEFFTAKDYPTQSSYTPLKSLDYSKKPFLSFLFKEIINRKTVSQGFLVVTNDMHGKMKSQKAFSESDDKTPLSASYHTYKNTGKNGLNDVVDFIHPNEGGVVRKGNIGIDMELMTDVREFRVESNGLNGQFQTDIFPFPLFPFAIYTLFPLYTYMENKYRAVSTTKLINYHAIEDSVIVMDKGSVVTTKTIAYDAKTGSALVSQTANEFKDPIYNVSYPAYWAYPAAGTACSNIDRVFTNVNFIDGRLTTAGIDINNIFESGDELYIISSSTNSLGCVPISADVNKIWVYDLTKNTTALAVANKDLMFIDQYGYPYTRANVKFKIVRSGKRNLLGMMAGTVTAMKSPFQEVSGVLKLKIDATSKVVAANATNFKEKWQADYDVFKRRVYYNDACTGLEIDSLSCSGIIEKNINPYQKGLLGNLKTDRAFTFYGERNEANPATNTAIRKNGYINNFVNYWDFNTNNFLVPGTDTRWVWNSSLTKVNAKGQELETVDALYRYASAQYGFSKNMTVAMTQNARHGEATNEGFEDIGYEERINPTSAGSVVCNKRYFDLSGLTGSSIVSAETEMVKAHSGKKFLKVNANTTVTKPLMVRANVIDNYHFDNTVGNISAFIPGTTGTSALINQTPSFQSSYFNFPVFSFGNLSMSAVKGNGTGGLYGPTLMQNGSNSSYYGAYSTTQYVKIITAGTYTFTLDAYQTVSELVAQGNPQPVPERNRATITVNVYNLNNTSLMSEYKYSDEQGPKIKSVYLACGIYKVYCTVSADLIMPGVNLEVHQFSTGTSYTSNITGILGTYTTCNYNKPIPAKDSMLNVSEFALVPDKRMYFSAWVREQCTTPCYKTDYEQSLISITTNAGPVIGGNIKRTGNIIEGWQKIEGEFTVPAGATSGSLLFTNSNTTGAMYVDDIRIHPFNSNMKTYVYDPRQMRLSAELDENNYASFYEYDEEGQLIRVKKETIEGIKTIKESRSAKQRELNTIQ